MYKCPRCGNENEKYIGYINGKPYCRFCISMKGELAKKHVPMSGSVVLKLNYKLSAEQKEISDQVISNFRNGIDTLINAVCGAGKTELVYGVICEALSRRMTVCFAIPRRDVVIELFMRIKEAFPNNSVVAVYGGNTSKLEADIVVATTHQLFRYPNYFDLIILDEIDAFPYKGNDLLTTMFKGALRGHSVLMSATPSKEVLEYYSHKNRSILELNTRFHKHPLPVPQLVIRIGYFKVPYLVAKLKQFKRENKPVFIFAPTIEKCANLYEILAKLVPNGFLVHSKRSDRKDIISDFKNGKYSYLITTAVLERGVTIKNLQVIIFEADHKLYDEYALIQISGRVGRKYDAPEGEAIFLANKETTAIKNAIRTIKERNMFL